jgi:hypothetical protein
MVKTLILSCVLNRHQIAHLLHNAYRRAVALGILAYGTTGLIAQVIAHLAVAYVTTKARYAASHLLYGSDIHLQQVHRQTQSRAATYAGQLGKLRNGILQ